MKEQKMYIKKEKSNIEDLAEQIIERLFTQSDLDDYSITENKLAEEFGISRSQIRDSLKDLEKIGIIERKQKKGISLKKPSSRLLAEVYDVRSILEGFAGRLATNICCDNDISEMNQIAQDYTEAQKQGMFDLCDKKNYEFHNRIVMLSGNKLLIEIMNSYAIVKKAFKLAHAIEPEEIEIPPELMHETIVEKLKAKDAEGCEDLIRAHIQYSKKSLIEKSLGFKLSHFD